jgi:hypothetical protein
VARSHHRKKHKQHLRSYQQSRGPADRPARTKVRNIFTLIGLALGLGIAYFAVNTPAALVIGAAAGTAIGYFTGKKMDESA